jgi:hypothetical protein
MRHPFRTGILLLFLLLLIPAAIARPSSDEKKRTFQERFTTEVKFMNYMGNGHLDYTENGKTLQTDLKISPSISWDVEAYYRTGRRLSDRIHLAYFGIANQPITANPNGSLAPTSSSTNLTFSGNMSGTFQMSMLEAGYEKSFFFRPGSYRVGGYLGLLYGLISMDGLNTSANGVSGTIGTTAFTDGSFNLTNLGRAWYRGPVPNIYLFGEKFLDRKQSWLGSARIIGTPEVGDDNGKVSSLQYQIGISCRMKRWTAGIDYFRRDIWLRYQDAPAAKSGNMKFEYSGYGLKIGYSF